MAWTTPRTWTTGELVTAAIMNAHVRDNFNALAPITLGQIVTGNGTAPAFLSVGANNLFLVADSACTAGMKWGNAKWTSFTPSLYQSIEVAASTTTIFAKYWKAGNLVHLYIGLAACAAGSAGNAIQIRLPSLIAPCEIVSTVVPGLNIGTMEYTDAGNTIYITSIRTNPAASSTCILQFVPDQVGDNFFGITPNFAIAAGDLLRISATYEA